MLQKRLFIKKHRLELRKNRIGKKIFGAPDRPRLNVYRSLKHIYVQVVDDTRGQTILGVSTLSEEIKDAIKGMKKTDQAKAVGKLLADKLIKKDIKTVVFDRNGLKYHGRIKALADASREAGLKF